MKFLVDDGPLDDLSEVFSTRSDIFPAGLFLVAEPTAREAEQSPARKRFLASAACRVLKADAQGEVARILYRFRDLPRKQAPTADLGEHYAIAWLLSQDSSDVAFVATDKKALTLALLELGGGQVSHSFQLWIHLYDQGLIDFGDLEKLLEKTAKGDKSLPDRPWRMPPRPV